MTAGILLMKILITPSAKSVLVPLGLSAGMLAAVAAIKKNIYGSGLSSNIGNIGKQRTITYLYSPPPGQQFLWQI